MALVRLLPAFKDYLWGGTKLKENYNKKTDLDIVAESWELSTHKDGQSIVDSGEYKGLTLSEYVEKLGKDALGTKGNAFEFFPILIKFIDAKGNLSIQVHPDNEYALRVEKEYGKTEMWYILDAEPESYLFIGPEYTISKEEFSESIEDHSLPNLLHKQYVKPGDAYLIPAGTIHAIGKGILLAEIQQSSDVTYRIYDYDRRDNRGRSRELHIQKACDVVNLTPVSQTNDFSGHLICCQYFIVDEKMGCTQGYCGKESFVVVLPISGSGTIASEGETFQMECGSCFFLPADSGEYSVAGDCKYLIASV